MRIGDSNINYINQIKEALAPQKISSAITKVNTRISKLAQATMKSLKGTLQRDLAKSKIDASIFQQPAGSTQMPKPESPPVPTVPRAEVEVANRRALITLTKAQLQPLDRLESFQLGKVREQLESQLEQMSPSELKTIVENGLLENLAKKMVILSSIAPGHTDHTVMTGLNLKESKLETAQDLEDFISKWEQEFDTRFDDDTVNFRASAHKLLENGEGLFDLSAYYPTDPKGLISAVFSQVPRLGTPKE